MSKGTLVLKTNGGERKMSYSLINGTYIMATKSTSNKVAQINADSKVTIDLERRFYHASLVGTDDLLYNATLEKYVSTMGGFQKFMYNHLFGKKNDMFIILKQA